MKKIFCLSVLFLALISMVTVNVVKADMQGNGKQDYKVKFQEMQQDDVKIKPHSFVNDDIFRQLQREQTDSQEFFVKMSKCRPAKLKVYDENDSDKTVYNSVVYGKTKQGLCSFAFYERFKGDNYKFKCTTPMKVIYGYSTTAYEAIDFYGKVGDKYTEAQKQNTQIVDVMEDYCKTIKL